jgi:hypothetical protein
VVLPLLLDVPWFKLLNILVLTTPSFLADYSTQQLSALDRDRQLNGGGGIGVDVTDLHDNIAGIPSPNGGDSANSHSPALVGHDFTFSSATRTAISMTLATTTLVLTALLA